MTTRCRFLWLILLVWLVAPAAARAGDLQSKVTAIVDSADLKRAKIGILIVDYDTGKKLAQVTPDEPLMPASNMKLLTTAAAAKTLGADFVFRTELRVVEPGDWPAAAGVKGSTLVLHGDGDPGLADPVLLSMHNTDVEQFLALWVKAVRDAGVQSVEQLIVDDRVFERLFVHPSWPADQLNRDYCAQVAGINFYDNCLDIYAEPTARGQGARVRLMPAAPFLTTVNRSVTGNTDGFLVNRKAGTNDLTFSGEVKTRHTQAVNVTLQDPPAFLGAVLADRLAAAGVKVGRIVRPEMEDAVPAGRALQAVEDTLPLILQRCNKDSQNLFAESLFKRMGRAVTGAPGSWENGAAAVRLFLRDTLGTQAAQVTIADGCGLSRENRVTASVMVALLTAMHHDPKLWPVYRDSLSIRYTDGAVKRRFRNLAPDLKATLFPKTGSINGVSTISGYVVAPRPAGGERTVVFSLLFNDFKVYPGQVINVQDDIIRLLDRYVRTNPN